MNVKFSCVVDQHPRFSRQAFVWASSLLVYGGADVDSLIIHTVGKCATEYKAVFDTWGIQTQIVQPFDLRHPNSNKLAQLESSALQTADYVVLFDCDIAFCGTIAPWIAGDAIRARIASSGGLPLDRWTKLFNAAGLFLPPDRVEAIVTGKKTLPTYVNGGFYIIPQLLFQRLREAWPRWNRWLLDREALIKPFAEFTDQISFAMSCAELQLSVDHLPLELNFDTVYLPPWLHVAGQPPVFLPRVLHYHRLNAEGVLRAAKVSSVNWQVCKINNLIRLAEQVNFDIPSLLLLRERRTA